MLMQKLGLATHTHVEMADFNCYLDLFRNGLFEEYVRLIRELFTDHCPTNEVCVCVWGGGVEAELAAVGS
jgi:hypothetical protein